MKRPKKADITASGAVRLSVRDVVGIKSQPGKIDISLNPRSTSMQITQAHITKIHTLLDQGLVQGMGDPEPGKMCVEAAICYALDLPHGDDPGCVANSIRQLKIRLNDSDYWTSNTARANGLRRLAIAQLGSRDAVNEKEFAARVARLAIQTVVPGALRSAARLLTGEHSTKLLALALKCEQEPTEKNSRAASAAAYAAYAATSAATSAANAAAYAAANAAAYAAYAATYAYAAAAAYAAYAATYAYAAAAYAEKILIDFAEGVVQILVDMKAPGCQWL